MKNGSPLITVAWRGFTAFGFSVLLAFSVHAAGLKSASVTARASVLQPASVAVPLNLSTGTVKTQGNNSTGVIIIPGSYPTLASPAPSYPSTTSTNGSKSVDANAARIDVTGAPGAAFTLNFQGWTELSGAAGSTASIAANTYYSPSNSPTNVSRGVFNAQGKATIYVGSTVTVTRDNSGTTVIMKPNFTITYN